MEEDFVIDTPYCPTDREKEAIQHAKSDSPSGNDWGNESVGIKEYKSHLKDYLYDKQNGMCAYCRRPVPREVTYGTLDHIVNKNDVPQWTFLPRNLCFSCEICNTNKGEKKVLVGQVANEYPTDSESFLIINPYLDKYFDHIELYEGIIYRAKTEKGKRTIEYCKLDRDYLVLSLAKDKIKKDYLGTIEGNLLEIISSNCSLSDMERIIKNIAIGVKKNPVPNRLRREQ